jgi:hypothetical protein
VQSTCLKAYNFVIHAAAKMSAKKACTNVPIKCDFCSEVHWKYNIHRHLQERHASWEQRGDQVKFREKVYISPEEEERLGIPGNCIGRPMVVQWAYDARRTNCLPSIRDLHGESPRRPHRTQPMQNPPVPVPFTLPVMVEEAYPSHSYDQSQRDVFY